VAKEQAGKVGQGAADAGQHVAGVAKDQAANVASEATQQAKNLLDQTTSELREQAAAQQQQIAAGIRSLSSELASMADRSDQSGTASDLVRQASQQTEKIASWLDERDPGSLVQEVSSFARRRPGAFLAIAAGAGLLAGRLTRGAVDAARDDSTSADPTYSEPTPYEPLYSEGRPQP
jgi:phytoene dehydrogenase-like protein